MLTPGLYLVPTPIGNREDLTLRALRTLRECDAVYCEDTRHTGQLLAALETKKPLLSCHAHNENARAAEMIAGIADGRAFAYASDAGMPGISDPGARLLRAVRAAGLYVTVLPGPSASLTALVLSGFDAQDACFAGFLPRAGKERRARIAALGGHCGPVLLYESPLRLGDTCAELCAAWGEREAALCRELSKMYEECVPGTLAELAARYRETPPKGECVLVVAPRASDAAPADAEAFLAGLLGRGVSAKDAAKQASALCDLPRNEAYALALRLQEKTKA